MVDIEQANVVEERERKREEESSVILSFCFVCAERAGAFDNSVRHAKRLLVHVQTVYVNLRELPRMVWK